MSEVSEGIDYYNASSDEYGSDDDDDDNFDAGYYGVGRIGYDEQILLRQSGERKVIAVTLIITTKKEEEDTSARRLASPNGFCFSKKVGFYRRVYYS